MSITSIATFMSAGIIGGVVLQYPLGVYSDRLGPAARHSVDDASARSYRRLSLLRRRHRRDGQHHRRLPVRRLFDAALFALLGAWQRPCRARASTRWSRPAAVLLVGRRDGRAAAGRHAAGILRPARLLRSTRRSSSSASWRSRSSACRRGRRCRRAQRTWRFRCAVAHLRLFQPAGRTTADKEAGSNRECPCARLTILRRRKRRKVDHP